LAATPSTYVGRFAPSPTGPLHFGSLLAAVASYLDAKAHRGTWLVRIEDLDGPRNARGASERILRTLQAHGLDWDEPPSYQSQQVAVYADAISALAERRQLFFCCCSRRELRRCATYPGRCRNIRQPPGYPHAIRVSVPERELEFVDLIQGRFTQRIDREVGDFVVRRRDGIIAYQLAVVVDDARQGVTRVVRGADLLDNTPRQMLLAELLGYPVPAYAHLPVIVDRHGRKLSKQTRASAVEDDMASINLYVALDLLGQMPPAKLCRAPPAATIGWASENWDMTRIPRELAYASFVGI
jgi:glutamyl-Q tRNA(Asp) synthetase